MERQVTCWAPQNPLRGLNRCAGQTHGSVLVVGVEGQNLCFLGFNWPLQLQAFLSFIIHQWGLVNQWGLVSQWGLPLATLKVPEYVASVPSQLYLLTGHFFSVLISFL